MAALENAGLRSSVDAAPGTPGLSYKDDVGVGRRSPWLDETCESRAHWPPSRWLLPPQFWRSASEGEVVEVEVEASGVEVALEASAERRWGEVACQGAVALPRAACP
jgi:hypothetical protein